MKVMPHGFRTVFWRIDTDPLGTLAADHHQRRPRNEPACHQSRLCFAPECPQWVESGRYANVRYGWKADIRLTPPFSRFSSNFRQPLSNSILQFGVVGMQVDRFPGHSFELRGQFKNECLRRRMDRPCRLDSAPPRPLDGMSERTSCRNFCHEAGLSDPDSRRN